MKQEYMDGIGLEQRFYVRLHFSQTGEIVVAVCDEELLGKTITVSKDFAVKVDEAFYGGILLDEESTFETIKKATIVNLLGERIVNLAIKKGLISSINIPKVGGVPHIQIII